MFVVVDIRGFAGNEHEESRKRFMVHCILNSLLDQVNVTAVSAERKPAALPVAILEVDKFAKFLFKGESSLAKLLETVRKRLDDYPPEGGSRVDDFKSATTEAALRSCLSCIQLHPALTSIVWITNVLGSQFVTDKLEFCSIVQAIGERNVTVRFVQLLSSQRDPAACSKDLTEFKQAISACEHVSAELARLNDATCTRLFAPIRMPRSRPALIILPVPASSSSSSAAAPVAIESELTISVEAMPTINKLPQLAKSEFCLCHAQPISAVGAKAAGQWCPVSKKKLRKADLIEGLTLGTVTASMPKPEGKKAKKDDAEPVLSWLALRRVELSSLNIGLLFGEPLLVRPSSDMKHKGLMQHLWQSLVEQDCGLLLGSTVEPGVKLAQQCLRNQLHLMLPDVAAPGCAIIQTIASKEEMLLLDGAESHTKVKLPPNLQSMLDASIAGLERGDYNPLDFESGFQAQLELLLDQPPLTAVPPAPDSKQGSSKAVSGGDSDFEPSPAASASASASALLSASSSKKGGRGKSTATPRRAGRAKTAASNKQSPRLAMRLLDSP